MSERIWPTDKLGNQIKEGKMVLLELPKAEGFFYVMSVTPATILHGTDGAYPVSGDVELALKFKLPFSAEQCQLHKAVVVEQPKQDGDSRLTQ